MINLLTIDLQFHSIFRSSSVDYGVLGLTSNILAIVFFARYKGQGTSSRITIQRCLRKEKIKYFKNEILKCVNEFQVILYNSLREDFIT